VPIYNAYFIGPDGRICGVEPIDAADDECALQQVARKFPNEFIELWQEKRIVSQVKNGVIVRI
jgi:hypothetical protein